MGIRTCSCCGASMLEHVRSRQLYWLCTACGFEMPICCFTSPSRASDRPRSPNASAPAAVTPQTPRAA